MMDKDYVFISYSSTDSVYVKQLTDILKECGIAYWKAPEMIPAGSNYAKEIPKAIRDCSLFLLVVSGTSQKSIWVEKEVDAAICNHKKIIPIKIDETVMNDMFRFYLNNVQVVEVETKYNMPLSDEMCDLLKKVLKEAMAAVTKGSLQIDFVYKDNIQPTAGAYQEKESDKEDNKIETQPEDNQNMELHNETEQGYKAGVYQNVADTRSNALRLNKIPIQCECCNGPLKQITIGVYQCVNCHAEYYDDLKKVRNFLEEVGVASTAVIARCTGVSVKTIEYFWQNDLVSRPQIMEEKRKCSKCGAEVEVGYLCEACRLKQNRMDSGRTKGVWHSEVWRK